MTKTLDKTVATLSYPASKLPDGLESVLHNEFPELSKCDQIDCRLLWKENEKHFYRVNGWKSESGVIGNSNIIFSVFVIAWDSEKGIQYKIPEKI